MGTLDYMAPEQAKDATSVEIRADVYSLGCTLFYLLAGRAPYSGPSYENAAAKIVGHLNDPFPLLQQDRPDIPDALVVILDRMAAKAPADRYTTAAEVAEALKPWATGCKLADLLTAAKLTPAIRDTQGPISPSTANQQQAGTLDSAKTIPAKKQVPHSRRKIVLAASILLAACVLVGVIIGQKQGIHPGPDAGRTGQATPATAYQGSIDLLVWHTDANQQTRKLRLNDPGALPLHPGDQFRIIVQVQPAGYLYLFWIDTDGAAVPVYPWKPGQWGTRPDQEQPLERLELPPQLTTGYTIDGDVAGMETLVLLVRPDQLSDDDASLRRDLSGLPAQRPVQNPQAAVWFENGRVVENDPLRQRANFEVKEINDPVLRLQDRLVQKLQPRGQFTAAVSFARLAR
jgi:hypothetical protein